MGATGRKLLIIDDDDQVRQNIVAYLEDSDFEVAQAAGGQAAIDQWADCRPDLVVCDLIMPGVSGLEVLKHIQTVSPDVPVIVISGSGEMVDVVEALRLGARDYLTKPIADMAVLEHAVRQALAHSDLVGENRRYREELEAKNAELLKNLHLFERDQMAGRQVQERLLPPTPIKRLGYTISRYIHPSLYLSGDFVDYVFFMNRYLGFYLTDVSGHGASSAFVTIWLKYLVRNLMRDRSVFKDSSEDYVYQQGPNLLLQGINRELIATRLNNHLTSFQGAIDCKAHKMRYAVGGHLPMPILVTEEGARYLAGKGKPLGIFKEIEWDVYEVELPAKCALLIFSDGVLETLPGENIQDKEARLLEEVSNLEAPLSIDKVCESLGIDRVIENPDDIAVMMVTRGH